MYKTNATSAPSSPLGITFIKEKDKNYKRKTHDLRQLRCYTSRISRISYHHHAMRSLQGAVRSLQGAAFCL